MCPECGFYNGKMVVDIVAKKEAKLKKAQSAQDKINLSEEKGESPASDNDKKEKSAKGKKAKEKKNDKDTDKTDK